LWLFIAIVVDLSDILQYHGDWVVVMAMFSMIVYEGQQ